MKRILAWLTVWLLLCPAALADAPLVDETMTLQAIMELPMFADCGPYLFDREARSGRTALTLAQLRNRYAYFDPDEAVRTLNLMAQRMEAGTLRWIPLYTEEECAADPSLQDAGMFFFQGAPQAPFAIICAGGGFEYVSAMTEGFPHAVFLNEWGYHAFVLHYRTGQEAACDDLRRALACVFEHAQAWDVSVDDYALWGASAGAAMAVEVGSDPGNVPPPAALVIQYMDALHLTERTPPIYACVGQKDALVSWEALQQALEQVSGAGGVTEFHLFPGLGHGFGLGVGTEAEGWINDAVAFWRQR